MTEHNPDQFPKQPLTKLLVNICCIYAKPYCCTVFDWVQCLKSSSFVLHSPLAFRLPCPQLNTNCSIARVTHLMSCSTISSLSVFAGVP